jgi:hypothetical protein
MDPFRPFVNIAVRVQEAVILTTRQAPVHELETADFDDPMALCGRQARRFGIQYHLSHVCHWRVS